MSDLSSPPVLEAITLGDVPPSTKRNSDMKVDDLPRDSDYFDASPHTSSEDEEKSDPLDIEYVDGPNWFHSMSSNSTQGSEGISDEEFVFDSTEVRNLISSVDDYVSRDSEELVESQFNDLSTIPENVVQELRGEIEFYKTNLMQVESKYTMLLESYHKTERANHEKEQILKKYLVTLQRASLTPEYVCELQETIIKLKGEIGVLQQQLLRNNEIDASLNEVPLIFKAHQMQTQKSIQTLEEENKVLKATVLRLQEELGAQLNKESTESFVEPHTPTGRPSIEPATPTLNENRALSLLLSDKFLDQFTKRIVDKLEAEKKAKAKTNLSKSIELNGSRRGSLSRTNRSRISRTTVQNTTKRKRKNISTPSTRPRPKSPRPGRPDPKSPEEVTREKIKNRTDTPPPQALSPVRRLSLSDQLEKLKSKYQSQKVELQERQKAYEREKQHMTPKEAKKLSMDIQRLKRRLSDKKVEIRKLKKLISDPTKHAGCENCDTKEREDTR